MPILFKHWTPGSHCPPHKRGKDRVQHVSYGNPPPPLQFPLSFLQLPPFPLSPLLLFASLSSVTSSHRSVPLEIADHMWHLQSVHHQQPPASLVMPLKGVYGTGVSSPNASQPANQAAIVCAFCKCWWSYINLCKRGGMCDTYSADKFISNVHFLFISLCLIKEQHSSVWWHSTALFHQFIYSSKVEHKTTFITSTVGSSSAAH